jgi:hypothetical protein
MMISPENSKRYPPLSISLKDYNTDILKLKRVSCCIGGQNPTYKAQGDKRP